VLIIAYSFITAMKFQELKAKMSKFLHCIL